ncbi:MAG: MiaB/RimO family radical SAM methylthiotransferase [Thermoguttaceae bacterium]|jgi:threonylcarbamoyladenosine tRNA methylthiotransferase MtaB
MRFKTATLGCKVNQYETEWLRSAFVLNGWEDADDPGAGIPDSDVDLVIVNTCSVTTGSDAKSRKLISHFAQTCPGAEIVVVGCYAATDPERVAALPGVTQTVQDKRRLPEFLRERGLEKIPHGVSRLFERRRAYVKIQDGCRVRCAYCIIPTARPYLASRGVEEILEEARTLSENGYREIVLTGIHLGHYGLDLYPPTKRELEEARKEGFEPGSRPMTLGRYLARQSQVPLEKRFGLTELLERLIELKLPQTRFRLGSLEAVEVSDKMIEVVASAPDSVCPHFHLSMQSGDDSVLRAMRRRWLSGPYIEKCEEIRARIPDAAITTDVIVGFPGETDAQFERTLEVVREVGFSRVHAFRFSARPGTAAASMPDQIASEVKKERAARLAEVAREERIKFARRRLGKTARVVVERVDSKDGRASVAKGTTDRYYEVDVPAPPSSGILCGDVMTVKLVGLEGDVFQGEIV